MASFKLQRDSQKALSARFGITRTMPNTTVYSFGDVALVPFPYTDQTAAKQRPAVVVSSDDYHRERQDVILVAVTSRTADGQDGPAPSRTTAASRPLLTQSRSILQSWRSVRR